ncbi:unnamed protein product [Citrullus colocynthis]|uniref:Uncharacterized protein n=1 Tax=Citrullus colocynthis TaxID=252529 RepID=A0ABP0YRW5_9ROSI
MSLPKPDGANEECDLISGSLPINIPKFHDALCTTLAFTLSSKEFGILHGSCSRSSVFLIFLYSGGLGFIYVDLQICLKDRHSIASKSKSFMFIPTCICDTMSSAGEKHLQAMPMKQLMKLASRAHKRRPQLSLQKVRRASITDSSIHCSIVMSIGEICRVNNALRVAAQNAQAVDCLENLQF